MAKMVYVKEDAMTLEQTAMNAELQKFYQKIADEICGFVDVAGPEGVQEILGQVGEKMLKQMELGTDLVVNVQVTEDLLK